MHLKFALLPCLMAISIGASASSLTGDTVTCATNNPPSVYSCSSGSAVVNSTTEFTIGGGDAISVEFTDNSLVLNFVQAHNYTATVLTFTDTTNAFSSAALGTFSGLPGLDASNVSLDGDGTLAINLVGVDASAGDTATISLATAPEPSSIALLGTGLLGAVGVGRRRFAGSWRAGS